LRTFDDTLFISGEFSSVPGEEQTLHITHSAIYFALQTKVKNISLAL